MGLSDRDRILAVSPDAGSDFSYLRKRAQGIPRVRPRAEEVLALGPDLIVRSYGGGPAAAAFFRKAGVPVVQIGSAPDLAGIRRVITETAAALNAEERGEALVASMDARLAAAETAATASRPSALYLTPGGVAAGPGTLVHELLTTAGLGNFQSQDGFQEIPLERLAYEVPDLFAAAFFRSAAANRGGWSASRHPVLRNRLETGKVIFLQAAWTSCPGWFVLDAVEALARHPIGPGALPPSEPLP